MREFIRHYVFRSIWIIMTMQGFHAIAASSPAQDDFFDESVIQKWRDYETFSHSLQGTSRSQGIRNGKSQESIKRYKQNRECALYIEPNNREPSLLICSLVNPDYMATINLSKPDFGNAVLRDYTPLPRDAETPTLIDGVFSATSRHFCYGATSRLRRVVSAPSFKVERIVKETQNGQELIRVDHIYDYVLHVKNNEIHVRSHGSLWLDPSRCWCIRRLKTSAESATLGERISETESELVFETIDHPSGFPILKTRTDHYKRFDHKNKQKSEGTLTTEYELDVNDSAPNSEFTLSAFGLPEPGGDEVVKKPLPIYVWILLVAGVCGAMALGFRYLARRIRPMPAA